MNLQGSVNPNAAESLIADFRATRVQFTSWGVRRALTDDQKSQAADAFGADAAAMADTIRQTIIDSCSTGQIGDGIVWAVDIHGPTRIRDGTPL